MRLYTLTLRFTNGHSHMIETTDRSYVQDLSNAAWDSVTCGGFTVSWQELPEFLADRDRQTG